MSEHSSFDEPRRPGMDITVATRPARPAEDALSAGVPDVLEVRSPLPTSRTDPR
jgi:hypothetical protein